MKTIVLLVAVALLPSLATQFPDPQQDLALAAPVGDAAPQPADAIGALLHFEPNRGQAPPEVSWLGRGAATDVLVLQDRLRFVHEGDTVDLIIGPAVATGLEPTGAVSHHYLGAVRVTDVPLFAKLQLSLGGHDVVLRAGEDAFAFDHVIAPGTSPDAAGFTVEGAAARLEQDGSLSLVTKHGAFHVAAPYTYQESATGQRAVASEFRVDGDRVGYTVGAYDPMKPLVIDPAVKYSSFLGTTSNDYVRALKVIDPPAPAPADDRVVYVGGHSQVSTTFPAGLAGTTLVGPGGSRDAFVARFTYDLALRTVSVDWFVYFGGSSNEELHDLDALPDGTVAIAGTTTSNNMPVMNAVMLTVSGQTTYNGNVPQSGTDAFVARFDAAGLQTFGTYLASQAADHGRAVVLDGSGGVVVGGYCYCSYANTAAPFPTTPDSAQPVPRGFVYDEGFVSHIDTTTTPSSFIFSTFLGGGVYDQIYDVALDGTGVYVTGATQYNPVACAIIATYCPPFPTTPNAYMVTHAPSASTATRYSAFLTKFSPDGTEILFSTMFGGTGGESGLSLSLVGGEAWIVGTTRSFDLPTTGPALQAALSGTSDAFVTRFNNDGSDILYSSHFGTSNTDSMPRHRPIGGSSDLLIGMYSSGGTAATPGGVFTTSSGLTETYVARVAPTTGSVVFGTWFGGSDDENFHRAIDMDDQGNIYVGGMTESTGATQNFPVLNPLQPSAAALDEGFVAIIGKAPPTAVIEASATNYASAVTPLATPYQVLTYETITLDASGSVAGDDPIDTSLTEWELKDSGGTVLATSTGWPSPTFTGYNPLEFTDDGVYEVCLEIKDDSGGPYDHNHTACMDLEWLNRPPVASFTAPATTSTGTAASVTDTSTDMDGTVSSWSWDFGDGTAPVTSQNPSHTWSLPGTYTVTLTVTDDDGATDTTTFSIEVVGGLADPSPDVYSVQEGSTLTTVAPGVLGNDGTGLTATLVSDVGSGTLALSGDGSFTYTPQAGFTGTDSFTYKVSDGSLEAGPTTVTITVTPLLGPTAGFTWNPVAEGIAFTDISMPGDAGITSWQWTVGSLTSTAQHPTLDLSPGTHTARLVVSDANGKTAQTQQIVTVGEGSEGSEGSDGGDGRSERPPMPAPNTRPDVAQVPGGSEEGEWQAPATTEEVAGNERPVAVIEPVAPAVPGATVTLDGEASHDPDGEAIAWTWSQLGGPTVSLYGEPGRPSFVAPAPGDYRFRLTVSDGLSEDTATVDVRVDPVPQPAIGASHEGPLTVRLVDEGPALPGATHEWDLGDGTTVEGRDIIHTYAQQGRYQVTLRVVQAGVAAEASATLQVEQHHLAAPSAPAESSPTAKAMPLETTEERPKQMPEWLVPALLGALVVSVLAHLLRRSG